MNMFHMSIPGFHGYYSADYHGNIWRDEYLDKNGKVKREMKLKPGVRGGGKYQFVRLGGKTYTLHRLIAQAWIKNDDPVNKTTVNHKDGNTHNNAVSNLEWSTPSEQNFHANAMNLTSKKLRKYTVEEVDMMVSRYIAGTSLRAIARELNSDMKTVRRNLIKREVYKK